MSVLVCTVFAVGMHIWGLVMGALLYRHVHVCRPQRSAWWDKMREHV